MIPLFTDTPVRRTPWVNYGLIGLNVLVFLSDKVLGGTAQGGRNALGQIIDQGALWGDDLQLFQFFTYQFLHGDTLHLAGNMLFLWVFGNAVNSKLGNVTYLLFYLAGGVFAAVGHAYLHPDFFAMVGASGSIAAVTTAFLALFPRSRVTVLYFWIFIGTFELPSTILIIAKMILWDNIIAPSVMAQGQVSNVAFNAHLAGYAFGFGFTTMLLVIRALPRDQFDMLSLWRRWLQRQGMRTAMATPEAQARAKFGRVARPVSAKTLDQERKMSAQETRLIELRAEIAEALSLQDRNKAAELYEQLLQLDSKQVLSRTNQLEVANQLYTLNRLPQAAAAYEKLLSTYPHMPERDDVELLLGIIYARDLEQYEVAEGHLRAVADRISDDKRRGQCKHWLQVVAQQLGRSPGTPPQEM